VKVSVSLPAEDVELLDEYVQERGYPSRSAVVRRAVALLRAGALATAYDEAFAEWDGGEDSVLWDATSADPGVA
jgi:Arc/MetJ-type ribon-helix-helix transcriptional regulator